MPEVSSTIEVSVSPDKLMAVITDFAAYPSFLPEMLAVDVLRARPPEWEVRFTLRLIRPLLYTLHLTQPDPLHLRWTLVEGVFQHNSGEWSLSPLDDGLRTRATYSLDLAVAIFVPGNLVRSLTDRSLPEMLARFKAEAEQRHLL